MEQQVKCQLLIALSQNIIMSFMSMSIVSTWTNFFTVSSEIKPCITKSLNPSLIWEINLSLTWEIGQVRPTTEKNLCYYYCIAKECCSFISFLAC